MTVLKLERAGITSLKSGDFAGLTSLMTLDLSENSLTELPSNIFVGLENLSSLSLLSNSLTSLSADVFKELTELTILTLQGNNLFSLDGDIFDSLTRLERLNWSGNYLTTLPNGIFDNLTMLRDLGLSVNNLTSLPASLFQNNKVLSNLQLEDNNLATLPNGIFGPLYSQAQLCLNRNPGYPIFVPTAVVQDRTFARGAAATLDAGASGGPWGTNVTYAWTQTGGTAVTLTGTDTATPSFTAPATSGTLTFSVTVTGAGGLGECSARTDATTVTVTVERPCKDSYQGAVRLAGENRAMPDREGRLEICYDDGDEDMSDGDGWGVICDDYWTDNEANVACRQLGFVGAVDDMGRSRDGQGRSLPPLYFGAPDEGVKTWLDNVMCEGDETSLLECPRLRGGQLLGTGNLPVGVHNCRPSEAVGVRCTMTPLPPHVTGPAAVWGLPALTVFPAQLDLDPHWDSIDVVLQYRAPVTVDTAGGTPALSLLIGNDRSVPDNYVLAPYAAGSGSTRMLFRYFLPESFGSPGPVRVVRNSLHTRGGTIRGTIRFAGSDTDVPLAHGDAAAAAFIVAAPAMELMDADGDDSFGDGDKVEVTITFNEPVEVVTTGGTPSVALGTDDVFVQQFASYVRGSGSTALVFSYTKAAADAETSKFATLQLLLNGGRIKSKTTDLDAEIAAHHAATISTDFSAQSNQRVAPVVVGAPVLSEAGTDGFWTAGETVEVQLTFSEPVSVETDGGTPSIGLRLGTETQAQSAAYASGSGTAKLVFGYTLADDEGPYDTMLVTGDSLALNGGTIVSTADSTIDADLAHHGAAKAAVPEPVSTRATRGVADGPRATASFSNLPSSHDGETPFTVKLSFSAEPRGLSYKTVRDSLLKVTGGTVTKALRVTDGSDREWNVTVKPSQGYDITLTLPAHACSETAAVCIGGRPLSRPASATIAGKALTASLSGPAEHKGSGTFDVRLTFSMEPDVSYKTVRDTMFTVRGGTITGARRVDPPADLEFDIVVKPAGDGAVSLSLASALPACGETGAVCTAAGRKIEGTASVSIQGPATLSVADAEVEEGADATLEFTVRLSRARFDETAVEYATSDGTARAGSDYTETSGRLSFAALETSKTVSVPVLDDSHDEDSETLTLTLTNPSPSEYVRIADGTATGTIKNSDPLPKAWIARFGRTVAEQVMGGVENRLEAARRPGVEVSLGGRADRRRGAAGRVGGAGGGDAAGGALRLVARRGR